MDDTYFSIPRRIVAFPVLKVYANFLAFAPNSHILPFSLDRSGDFPAPFDNIRVPSSVHI